LGWHEADDVPDMRLGLALGADAPTASAPRRRKLELSGVSAAGQLRLKFGDPRDERLDPRDQCGDQGSFSGKSGGGVTEG